MADQAVSKEHFDFFVIGGGSGGLAASKAAAALGKKVGVADFVKPSPAGTTWGLGGTCVNVGCIPKKLFHASAQAIEAQQDSHSLGWTTDATHDWEKMVTSVNQYINSINWNYKSELKSKNVKYFNAFATFIDATTLALTNKKGVVTEVTAEKILIACGGRPSLGGYPGVEECCISSDDIFWRKGSPGRTLVVGASYIALECAGFVATLGFDTTVMVRSILLRGFDRSMAEMIGAYMKKHGVKFAEEMVPTRFEKTPEGRTKVFAQAKGGAEEVYGEFDTVLMAVGRNGCAHWMDLEKAGVDFDPKNGKIIGNPDDSTSVPHIFAIGDVVQGCPELTPVAIQAGRLLVDRLYGGKQKKMDYVNIPTTVFTPIEYGCCGYSEEDAKAKFGKNNLSIYHSYFKPLEWQPNHERAEKDCYVKLICDKAQNEKVIGFHILGPQAGEMTQAVGVAMKAGATKEMFDDTIGIHPTNAEVFTSLTELKEEGKSLETGGGC